MAAKNGDEKLNLALFDFDGTITKTDSFRELLVYSFGHTRLLIAGICLCPWLICSLLGLISTHTCKQKFLAWFYKGMTVNKFNNKAESYVAKRLHKLIRPAAMKRILWHLQQGDKVIIVSASFEEYLKLWCKQHDLDCIASKMEQNDGEFTGKILGKNCWGPEKVVRIKMAVNLQDYKTIYAYGDTRGDKEMLSIAHEKYWRPFN